MAEHLDDPSMTPDLPPVQAPQEEVLQELNVRRLIWPVLLGVSVMGYTVWKLFSEGVNPISHINFTVQLGGWLLLGLCFMALRDIGYMWRLRLLSDQRLNWRSAFDVALLWEFASALTPSVVGGSALAAFMLIKEKLSAGRSTAIVFVTILLDEMFYILIMPLILLVISQDLLFGPVRDISNPTFGTGLVVTYWIAYVLIVVYTLFLAIAFFVRPDAMAGLVRRLVRMPLLRRWQAGGDTLADELLISAREFRSRDRVFWVKAGLATAFAWFGRYLVLNCVLAAFAQMGLFEHMVAFGRQAILFMMMLIAPTPGSAGIAESVYSQLYQEFLPGAAFTLLTASVWRLLTYYPYLLIGMVVFPRWLRKVYKTSPPQLL
ncbi:MAG: lysylphosphatidylglycerol synthase transmembrane domain-containing protein [Bacteroidia bacterium]|nr:lysylphosphatidylglycerol synthase transmembrane domain-containing protein [Bacteroidia bacterium]